MDKNISYILFLLWLCYLIVSSILLFTNGFLMTKIALNHSSTCISYKDVPCVTSTTNGQGSQQCTTEEKLNSLILQLNSASTICLPRRTRVILLIVDALRYDFTIMNDKLKTPLPYQNKLPIIDKLLKQSPNSTRLYKFLADPPTTTLQRLKGLTTGSLPTFIDASSNFGSPEIAEDNIIDQLENNGFHVVFTGDDTWTGLYPKRFARRFPFPSFDVWDLDTVDEGVRQTIYSEINNTDWSLLIGHLLGVDHCGHHYGPNHPEMTRKLSETNDLIHFITDKMDEDTILFVIGDHGMTSTGDHGGETEDEVTAALFVHSKRELLNWKDEIDSVRQIGIVPTLATILGVPIPFENLGTLIPSCLPRVNSTRTLEWQQTLYSLWANVQQMVEYIKYYAKFKKDFNEDILRTLHEKYSLLNGKVHTIDDEESFQIVSKEIMEYLRHMHDICFNVWVQYDSFSMTRGLLFLFLSIFFVYIIIDGIPANSLPEIFKSSFILVSYIALFVAIFISTVLYYLNIVDNLMNFTFFITGVTSQFMLSVLIIQNWEVISLNWYDSNRHHRFSNLIFRLVMLFNILGVFSNSFILEEGSILLYLLITILVLCMFSIKLEFKKRSEKWSKFLLVIFAFSVAGMIRLSKYYWICRSDQVWCRDQPHITFNYYARVLITKLEWGVSVIGLAFIVMCTKIWLRNCGNLNGFSLTVLLSKYLPSVIVVCMAGYWVLNRLETKKSPNIFQAPNVLAWSIYFASIFGSIVTIIEPLCVFLLERNEEITVENNRNVIPQIFKQIKSTLMTKKQNKDVPVVCGLGTVYSAVFVIIGTYIMLLLGFLLGESLAITAVIMYFTAICLLILLSVVRIENSEPTDNLLQIPNMSILVWFILTQYFFYGTGHQPTFANIQWDAAFVGTKGLPLNNYISGALILINTFAANILMGFLLPLLVIAPFNIFVMLPSTISKRKGFEVVSQRGEVVLFERDDEMIVNAFVVASKYIALYGIRVFCSMLSAAIHCRHLMAWAIFAPKFIFESIGIFVTLVSVMLSFLILIRVNKKVENLIISLEKSN